MSYLRNCGPGLLVTAAFIGPGTVTTASKAGAEYGFALVWALLFSVLATMVLQEMSARLGIVTRRDLAAAIRESIPSRGAKLLSVLLILTAIGLGNAAFQTGNVAGAAGGISAIAGGSPGVWCVLVGTVAAALLWTGRYRVVERCLIGLVIVMSAVFLVTAVQASLEWSAAVRGLWPTIPSGAEMSVIALIGTTVVPYNLFLHSSSVQQKWPSDFDTAPAVRAARIDTVGAVGLGGLITLAIMSTAVAAFYGRQFQPTEVGDLARQLEPTFGVFAKWLFGIGILAAGLTSAITAPLAAAYAIAGALGWPAQMRDIRFRTVWLVVLIAGTLLAAMSQKPVQAIVVAQAANGLLLPFVACFLLYVMNQRRMLGSYTNGWRSNVCGGAVVLVASALGAFQLWKVYLSLV